MRVAIVGAGMAGLSCGQRLKALGLEPQLFDKGKGPAGRMATRRLETRLGAVAIDMGAPYFTVKSPQFADQVADWVVRGLAAPWPDAGPDAWVGVPFMSTPLKAMAEGQQISWNTFVGGVSRGREGWRLHHEGQEIGPFDAVVLALPAEQATPLLALTDSNFMKQSAASASQPCWTGLFVFDEPLLCPAPLIRDEGVLSWAARSTSKPGRSGPEAWVVHARPDWSADHLEVEPTLVAELLMTELLALTSQVEVRALAARAHRWRFAKSTGLGLRDLWNRQFGLGVCGDWLQGPQVESAWLSGFQLAQRMIQEPSRRARARDLTVMRSDGRFPRPPKAFASAL